MHKLKLAQLALIAAGLVWLFARSDAAHRPTAPEQHADDMGTTAALRAALTGPHAKSDARYFSAVFAALAERLEADGRHTSPILTQRVQIETLIRHCGQMAVSGRTVGRYPELPGVIGHLFAKHFPTEQGKLEPADREGAIRLLRALAAGCAAVSSQ